MVSCGFADCLDFCLTLSVSKQVNTKCSGRWNLLALHTRQVDQINVFFIYFNLICILISCENCGMNNEDYL